MDLEEPTWKKPKHSSGGGGSSVEVAKRPRGRPLGSKNKPRPPTIVTRELDPSSAMRPHLLEIAPGRDIVGSLSAFSTRRNLGVCVLAATGSVSDVSLRRPAAAEGTLALRGSFEILSMSATFLAPGITGGARPAPADAGAVTISLAGPGGRVVGGTVVGPVVAAGTAMVVAAGFESVEFHRLPEEDEDDVLALTGREDRDRDRDRDCGDVDTTPQPALSGQGMSVDYSSHLPAESIWALPTHYSS